jgi:hypothetical protein
MLSAMVILGSFQTAWGEDFTFTVPVRVSNLVPEVNKVIVSCSVGTADGYTAAQYIGAVAVLITPDASGSYSGNLELKFNADTGKDRAAATHYRCVLRLDVGGTNMAPAADASSTAARPKPGTTFTSIVSGTLPQ